MSETWDFVNKTNILEPKHIQWILILDKAVKFFIKRR